MSAAPPREMRAEEAADVAALIARSVDAAYVAVYPPRAIAFTKSFHSPEKIRMRAETGLILVLEAEHGLAATGALVDGQIFGVFVDPAWKGRGLGRRVMQGLEARATAEGVFEIRLSISLVSKAFYLKLGYEIEAARAHDLGEGERLKFWSARKALSPQIP